jgi:hypothetical protein
MTLSIHNDTQYNDTHYNDTQYNDTHYNDTHYKDTCIITIIIQCSYAGCHILIVMMRPVMPNVVMLSVVIL